MLWNRRLRLCQAFLATLSTKHRTMANRLSPVQRRLRRKDGRVRRDTAQGAMVVVAVAMVVELLSYSLRESRESG